MPQKSELEQIAETSSGKSNLGSRLDRIVQIARYYRWKQMARRGAKLLMNRLPGTRLIGKLPEPGNFKLPIAPAVKQVANLMIDSYRNHVHHSRSRISEGHLVLLGESADLGQPINFNQESLRERSHLWRFHLEYHEFLLSLSPINCETTKAVAATLESWMNQNTPQSTSRFDDSWHPYCISRRIPVWIWLLATHRLDPGLLERISNSLYQQAHYLHNNLEFELGGNHLLENLAALSLASVLFVDLPAAQEWSAATERIFRRELRNQITPEGEHFERAPMYHCQVLGNLLIAAHCTHDCFPRISELCHGRARVMYAFIKNLLHPDGEIPLLGDSCFGESHAMPLINALAGLCGIESQCPTVVDSGMIGNYWISPANVEANDDKLIFDAGPVGADELPAHAHCDLLNIEASIGGTRWIVDSGNFNYDDDSMRMYCRSSVAHNVATVDRQNQCDVWSKFRMGYRGRITYFQHGNDADLAWACAGHDGYRRQGVLELSRLVVSRVHSQFWLCADHAATQREQRLVGYLHLAPGVRVQQVQQLPDRPNGQRFGLVKGDSGRLITFFNADTVNVRTGWYCPAFGIREQSLVFEYSAKANDVAIGWTLQTTDNDWKIQSHGKTLKLLDEDSTILFDWTFK